MESSEQMIIASCTCNDSAEESGCEEHHGEHSVGHMAADDASLDDDSCPCDDEQSHVNEVQMVHSDSEHLVHLLVGHKRFSRMQMVSMESMDHLSEETFVIEMQH